MLGKEMEAKKKIIKGFGLFMAAMIILTFVSRMVYVSQMPRVNWNYPSASSIRSTLTAEGTVEAVSARAITGMDGLLVKRVCVAAGEQIEVGTVLYEVDLDDLQTQLDLLEAEEAVWQEQLQAQRQDASTQITRAQEDYDTTVIELDREIETLNVLLEDAKEDLELHMFRIPDEDADDDTWIAWADERTRLDREIEEKERAIEDAELEKEKLLQAASRTIEDAQSAKAQIDGAYSASYSGISQVQERESKIEAWKALAENEGQVVSEEEGTVLEVMLQSGVRMSGDAVLRYADAQSSLIFCTTISQEDKSMVHTGDSVTLTFPGSSEEVTETIDSIVQENGGYTVTIWLEPGVAQGRTEGVMEVNVTSEIYDFVISKQALHNDGNTNFIYILEEKEGILGTELSVRSLTVRLLDENEDKVAVTDDLLSSDVKIVVDSDKELSSGDAVREE